MALWLHRNLDNDGFKARAINLFEEPAPTVTGQGIYGVARGCYDLIYDNTPPSNNFMKTQKPPYKVPSMAEINALPWNGYSYISTFSGCGGSSLGARMAAFKVLWASEFIPAAQEVYKMNSRPWTILDKRDIRQVQPEEILAATGLEVGELDVFDSSPPCSSFSTAGKREKGWGTSKKYSDSNQRTDDLFYETARIIKGLQPKVFICENVKGLTIGVAKEILGSAQTGMFGDHEFKNAAGEKSFTFKDEDTFMHRLMDAGYVVGVRVLNAKELGVPQSRQRAIFIGIRKDLAKKYNLEPCWPSKLPYEYTVRDALPWIVRVEEATGHNSQGLGSHRMLEADGAMPTIMAGRPVKCEERVPVRVVHDTSGHGNAEPEGSAASYSAGDITDRPCPAITVGVNNLNSSHYKIQEMVLSESDAKLREQIEKELADKPNLRRPATGTGNFGQGAMVVDPEAPSPAIMAGGVGGVGPAQYEVESLKLGEQPQHPGPIEPETSMEGTAAGRELENLKEGEQSEKYFSLVRPDSDKPCPTICASHGSKGIACVTHPTEKRKFSIVELKRICAFPDDFDLSGQPYPKAWERLGRAVPPVMMFWVAKTVKEQILDKIPREEFQKKSSGI
jgi:DNA (cytosine-5)-methyltransferase 1